jgi:hypothetical protein
MTICKYCGHDCGWFGGCDVEILRAKIDLMRMELDVSCNAEKLRQTRAERDAATAQKPAQPRTVREWLETIERPLTRAAALRNMSACWGDLRPGNKWSVESSLQVAFAWVSTPEGDNFWSAVAIGQRPPYPARLAESKEDDK